MKNKRPFVVFLLLMLTSLSSPVFAHEGEQHAAPDVAAVPVPGEGLLSLHGTTENFELVVKYPPMKPNKKGSVLVYLSDYATNAPVPKAEINVTIPGVPSLSDKLIKVEPTKTAGVYGFDLTLSKNGRYDLLFDISGERSDLIPVSGLEIATTSFWKEFRFPFRILKYLIPLLVIAFLGWRFREKIKPFWTKFSLILLLPLVFSASRGLAHEGESHGGPEPASEVETTPQDKIPLSKESQFLLGVRTVLVERKSLVKRVQALGKVVPRPQTSAEVFSMQEGVILPPSETGFPLPGQKVKKGDVLAIIQSIGSFPVRAPVAGTVTELLFTHGQHVEHDTKLLSIINFSTLWVEANIYESDLPNVQKGRDVQKDENVKIISETYPEKRFEGKLINVGQVIDPATRAAKAVFEVINPEELLRVGMFVQVAVETGETVNAVVVPSSAVIEKGEKKYVYVHTEPEIFEARPVSIGEKNGVEVVITEGVEEGERIVTEGNYQLSTTVMPQK